NRAIEGVKAAAPPPAPHANRRSYKRESPPRTAPTTHGADHLRRREGPVAGLRLRNEPPDAAWRSYISSFSQATIERSPPRGPDLDQSLPPVLITENVARTETFPGFAGRV